ncbi:MAG: hypothetical protein WD060_07025 [Pirellulales bacterium]
MPGYFQSLEHLALGIRMAKALGSPAFRVILGNAADRLTPGGIDARIADTVKVLRAVGGVAVQWTAMGEGCTDLPAFCDHFTRHCPGLTVHIETISGFAKTFSVRDRGFWAAYPPRLTPSLHTLPQIGGTWDTRRGPVKIFAPAAERHLFDVIPDVIG